MRSFSQTGAKFAMVDYLVVAVYVALSVRLVVLLLYSTIVVLYYCVLLCCSSLVSVALLCRPTGTF